MEMPEPRLREHPAPNEGPAARSGSDDRAELATAAERRRGASSAAASGQLCIRPAAASDLQRILDLLALSMGNESYAAEPEYWHWKHVLNPFGPSPCLVAEAGDRIVGVRVFMRWRWRSGDVDHDAVRAVDTATHPDWRRRGVFSSLTRALLDACEAGDAEFVFNTPNSRSRPGYLKMGWRQVERTALLVRPLRPLRVLRGALHTVVRRKGLAGSSALVSGRAPEAAKLFASRVFPELMAPRIAKEDRYHTVRSPGYLRWRYEQVPFPRYSAVWTGDPAPAAVVFRTKERLGLREVSICELLRSPDAHPVRALKRVLSELLDLVEADYLVACAVPGSGERSALLRAGFVPARALGPTLVVRPLSVPPAAPDPTRPASWRYSIGDIELF